MNGRTAAALLAACLICGCAGGRFGADIARYDLGKVAGSNPVVPGLKLLAVEVVSPSWLDSDAMQYRLSYVEATRRSSYAESRWVAAPGELIKQALGKALISPASDLSAGCRLRVDLDEFVQQFDSPNDSRGLVEARVTMVVSSRNVALVRERFAIERPAPTPDARGGAAALAGAVSGLIAEVKQWIRSLQSGRSHDPQVVQFCAGG